MEEQSPLAGKTVVVGEWSSLSNGGEEPTLYHVEDWWVNVSGHEWEPTLNNPAEYQYSLRFLKDKLPDDGQILYGKIGPFGHLLHASEIDDDKTKELWKEQENAGH